MKYPDEVIFSTRKGKSPYPPLRKGEPCLFPFRRKAGREALLPFVKGGREGFKNTIREKGRGRPASIGSTNHSRNHRP